MRTYGTSETFNVTPSRIVNIIMLNMLVGMKDSNVKYVINDLAASQDKKKPLQAAGVPQNLYELESLENLLIPYYSTLLHYDAHCLFLL